MTEKELFRKAAMGCLGMAGLLFVCVFTYVLVWTVIDLGVYDMTVDAVGMRFNARPVDEVYRISFGGTSEKELDNYIELSYTYDMGGDSFYFVVDNSSGKPIIKKMIFDETWFNDFHLPDYDYSVYVSTYERNPSRKYSFYEYFDNISELEKESKVLSKYFVVKIWLAMYDEGLKYRVYNLGNVQEYEALMAQIDNTEHFYKYDRLKRDGIPLGFYENMKLYGEPLERERVRISDKSKRRLIRNGWLCMDTLDLKPNELVEIDTWSMGERKKLTMLYKVESDSIYTPLKGAAYANYMYYSHDDVPGGRTIFYE